MRTLVPALPREGYTYAICTEPYDGWVKIGRSAKDPTTRLKSCQTGNARLLRVRVYWPVDVETFLHDAFADFRGQGEWFALPSALVQDMVRLRKRKEPWVALVQMWSPSRIRGESGLSPRVRNLDALAMAFATKAARMTTASVPEKRHIWRPSEEEQAMIYVGGPIEIVHTGEIRICRAHAPGLAAIGSKSGARGV